MYTDETVLDYGKYRGKMLKDIPSDYFVNVYKTGKEQHPNIVKYIEDNIDKFPGICFLKFKNGPPVTFICTKRTYATKKAAMESIVKPTSKSNRPIPIRAYECPECSMWHLTSKEYVRISK